jgi:chitin disaccharide deacetylase
MEPGLIVNADDLGVDAATTRGIASAYRNGIVSSASLMVTMPGLEEAVTTAQTMEMPVGLHLSLTQGCCLAGPRLTRLVEENGRFKLRAQDLITVRRQDATLIEQIRAEIRAQLRKAIDLGLTLTHVDSHQHVHMNPTIFALLEDEASTFGIRRIRFSDESLRFFWWAGCYLDVLARNNLSKWLVARVCASQIAPQLDKPDLFFGILHSGIIVKRVLLNVLRAVPADRSVEICIHPGLPDRPACVPGDGFAAFSASQYRRLEHDALVDAGVIELVAERGLTLRSFDGRAKRG